MKVDLVKKLSKEIENRKSATHNNEVLEEVKGLLEHDSIRDLNMMRMIGQSSTLVQSEREKGKVLEIEKQEEFLSGKIFTREQIISLGVKYRLKLLQSRHYTKYIPASVIPEIKDMERHISQQMTIERAKRENLTVEEYIIKTEGGVKYTIDDHKLGQDFFILAPASMFKTEKQKAITFTKKMPVDPVMFYSEDGQHFRLIKKWGSDFTIFRRILGWLTTSWRKHIWTLYILPLAGLTAYLFTKVGWWAALVPAVSIITSLIVFAGYEVELRKSFEGEQHVESLSSFYM